MANTQGTWVFTEAWHVPQKVGDTSTTQMLPFGTTARARDKSSTTAYGEGVFMYVKGVASGALNAWVGYRAKAGLTTLAVADGNYSIGVMCSTLDATTKYGWIQIKGRCIGKCLTAFADNGVVYLTSTAGSIDDASVIGDVVHGAIGRNGGTVTVGNLAGEFEINYPYSENRVSLTN
jgi:hypothetical protein